MKTGDRRGRGGRGGGRGRGGRDKPEKKKTKEELDAEMDAYFLQDEKTAAKVTAHQLCPPVNHKTCLRCVFNVLWGPSVMLGLL